MNVFIPLHDIAMFLAGFATMFFIALFAWIFASKDGGRDGGLY
jgi:ascorbate-specific PTS system EIIC-type component UlaA